MPIYINTNQNVNIEYEISSIGSRILAYVIDVAVIIGLSLVILFIGGLFSLGTNNPIYFSLFMIPAFFYHLICELTMNGQSIGKRAAKIRVMKTDGSSASFTNYFLRFLLRPIDSIYFVGLVFIFFTKKGQRLGDLAANTVIVKILEDVSLSALTNSMKTTKAELIYPEVDRLKDKDIEVIKKVLSNWQHQQEHENVILLAKKVESLLEIDSDQKPYTFLDTVVQDYHSMYS